MSAPWSYQKPERLRDDQLVNALLLAGLNQPY